jgi:hypothetical protein
MDDDDDDLDGLCDADLQPDPIRDTDIDEVVLYADIDPNDDKAIAQRKKEWKELFPDAS